MLRVIFIFFYISLVLFAKDYSRYIKVVDFNGAVKILSSKSIVKPANYGDLLFSRDNILTESNAYITAYLENKFLFKLKENSTIELLDTYDKKSNIHLNFNKGEVILVSELNANNNLLKISISNIEFMLSGTAIIKNNDGVFRIIFLNGFLAINNGMNIKEFSEVIVNNSNVNTNDLVMNDELRSYINEIISFPYLEKVALPNIYREIVKFPDGAIFNSEIITE